MDERKVYLNRERTCYINLENGIVTKSGTIGQITGMEMLVLVYLIRNAEIFCSYNALAQEVNNFESVRKDGNTDKYQIVGIMKKIYAFFKALGIKYSFQVSDLNSKDADIVVINVPGERNGGYTLYLPPQEDSADELNKLEDIHERLGSFYWEKYRSFECSNEEYNLLDVFRYPAFSRKKQLIIGNGKKKNLVEAPNGFGKSTLIKGILLASNMRGIEDVSENEICVVKDIREKVNITEDYFTFLLEAKDMVYSDNTVNIDSVDIIQWLFKSLKITEVNFEEFKYALEYYNDADKVLFLVDGFDEIDAKKQKFLSEILEKFYSAGNVGDKSRLIITSRPLFEKDSKASYRERFFKGFLCVRIAPLNVSKEEIDEYVKGYLSGTTIEDYTTISAHILKNGYLKGVIVTPYILAEVITQLVLALQDGKETPAHVIIHTVVGRMLTRFIHELSDKTFDVDIYEIMYERLAYELLNGDILNDYKGFSDVMERIKDSINKDKIRLFENDDSNPYVYSSIIYTNYSLLETTNRNIIFIAKDVLVPYFVARYFSRKFMAEFNAGVKELRNEVMKKTEWEIFEDIKRIKAPIDKEILKFLLTIMCNDYIYSNPRCNIDKDSCDRFLISFIEYLCKDQEDEIIIEILECVTFNILGGTNIKQIYLNIEDYEGNVKFERLLERVACNDVR